MLSRCGLAVVGCAVLVGTAQAQVSPAAEKMFRTGRELLGAGKIAEACEAFGGSARIEPSVGALLNLGDCRSKLGQTATAWGAFTAAARLAKKESDNRAGEAKRRADQLERKLSYLTIKVVNNVRELEIARDGELIDHATLGVAIPVDPGPHEIRARAPGFAEWSRRATIKQNGDRQTIVIELDPRKGSDPAPQSPTSPAPAVRREDDDEEERDGGHTFTSMRVGAVVVGAAGVAALGASTWLVLDARALYAEAREVCPAGQPCTDLEASEKSKRAASRTDLGLAIGGVGAAAVVTGVVLWIVGKPDSVGNTDSARLVPYVSPHAVGFGVAGTFR